MPNDACWLSSTVPRQFPATENPSDDFADISMVWGGRGMAGESRGAVRALDQPRTQQVCIANTNRESDGCTALLIQENQTSDEGV